MVYISNLENEVLHRRCRCRMIGFLMILRLTPLMILSDRLFKCIVYNCVDSRFLLVQTMLLLNPVFICLTINSRNSTSFHHATSLAIPWLIVFEMQEDMKKMPRVVTFLQMISMSGSHTTYPNEQEEKAAKRHVSSILYDHPE